MQLSLFAALALASSSFAAPSVKRNGAEKYSVPQHQVQDLEVTIVNVINDIVQGNSTAFDADYAHGHDQMEIIANGLQGSKACNPVSLPVLSSKVVAIESLQNTTVTLQRLSLDLSDSSKAVANNDFTADVCAASLPYYAIGTFHP